MAARIIMHNTSVFSFPLLVVKLKDRSCSFYVDYKALNKLKVMRDF